MDFSLLNQLGTYLTFALYMVMYIQSIVTTYNIGKSIKQQHRIRSIAWSNKYGLFLIIFFNLVISTIAFTYSFYASKPYQLCKPIKQSTQIDKALLEEHTKMNASLCYVFEGKSMNYYDQSLDMWLAYAPTDDEIKNHDLTITQNEKSKNILAFGIVLLIILWTVWGTVGYLGWRSAKGHD